MSTGVPHADRGAVVGIEFAAVAAFEFGPEVELFGLIGVGADALVPPKSSVSALEATPPGQFPSGDVFPPSPGSLEGTPSHTTRR